MAIELFGFQIGKKEEETKPNVISFAPPPNDDGTLAVAEGGVYGTTVDVNSQAKNEAQLITRYREMAAQPECERAIDDIINEAIVGTEYDSPVSIVLDNVEEMDDVIKDRVREEFDEILNMLNFHNRAYDIFKNWYIDGRLYYHLMIDMKQPRLGVQEIRYIDPRKIKKIRIEKRDQQAQTISKEIFNKQYNEYFVYSPKGVSAGNQGIKIATDSIAYCHSGLMDQNNKMVLSYIHKAIKPLNQLRMLEDATVIYRLARAPERRIFYIDVGNLPKAKAEQYLRDMMTKHKNKLVYDANTGEVRDDRKFLTMLEDYWLPRREGGKGTEITTLPGGQNLGEIEDVIYFQRKLYQSLSVPMSRLEADNSFNLGRATEISRDELKFSKFIARLRYRFSELFHIILEKQLLLKGIITKQEWQDIKGKIYYDFLEDNHFTELKNAEVMRERLNTLRDMDEYVGNYYSKEWVRKNVLMQTEEEIDEIDSQIEFEKENDPDMGDDEEQY
jgi:hypothetical protein